MLATGETLEIILPDVFTHNFTNLSISINKRKLKINKSSSKRLIDNQYLPNKINKFIPNFKFIDDNIITKIIRKFKHFLKLTK
jgi:hypothetical protein